MSETRTFNADGFLEKLIVDNRGTVKNAPNPDTIIDTYNVYSFTYYKTGEIDIIKTDIYDNNDTIIKITQLKHYIDGHQPEIL